MCNVRGIQSVMEIDYQCTPTYLDYVDVQLMQDILLKPISVYEQIYSQTEDVYFSHSDHLGSANWITDGKGKPIQYIHYAPYGELIGNQQAAGYDERYKFTGKERDWETGYYAFGARYLWSDAGTWLSVDPLADKYPNISPYAYAAWNPVKYVDPDGRDIYTFDSDGNFTGYIIKQEGDHIGRIYLSDDNYIDFTFNDQADAQRICIPFSDKYFSFSGKIDDNAITHVKFITNEQINNFIPKESTKQSNLFNAIMYAWSESRGGNLDFVNQPSSFLQNDGNTLFLPMDGLNVGYNSFDFGNYLWGQSMQRLNIPLSICLLGANIDNLLNHWPLQLDSYADQQAIRNGYIFKMIGK